MGRPRDKPFLRFSAWLQTCPNSYQTNNQQTDLTSLNTSVRKKSRFLSESYQAQRLLLQNLREPPLYKNTVFRCIHQQKDCPTLPERSALPGPPTCRNNESRGRTRDRRPLSSFRVSLHSRCPESPLSASSGLRTDARASSSFRTFSEATAHRSAFRRCLCKLPDVRLRKLFRKQLALRYQLRDTSRCSAPLRKPCHTAGLMIKLIFVSLD